MLTRILGDRPLLGGAKMLALCLLVGLALTAIGVDPLHLTRSLQGLMHRAAHIRTGALQWDGTVFYWEPCSSSRFGCCNACQLPVETRDLVAHPFADHLALELGERQQDIEREPPHAGGRPQWWRPAAGSAAPPPQPASTWHGCCDERSAWPRFTFDRVFVSERGFALV
jgi:hypothetical protein